MSTLKKAMHWLGLGPDDDYDGMTHGVGPYGVVPDPSGMAPPPPTDAPVTHLAAPPAFAEPEAAGVRTLGPMEPTRLEPALVPVEPATSGASPRIGPFGASPGSSTFGGSPGSGGSRVNTVRPIPAGSVASTKPAVLAPRTFNDAQEVGDKFRTGKPVIMDLQGIEGELARRLIDFASGACYAMKGHMEKVADKVYLLTPSDVEISPEDRIELREKGLYDG